MEESEWWEVIPSFDQSFKTRDESIAIAYYESRCKDPWNEFVYLIHSKTIKTYTKS